MAQLTATIKISGLEIAKRLAKKTMEELCIDDCSEDYKQGFFDFGNAFVEALEVMQKEGEEDGKNTT